jgi:hypothetical protein
VFSSLSAVKEQWLYQRDFSLQLSKRLADSDLAVIGLTGNGTIRKIAVLDWFLLYWPNESFYIVLTDRSAASQANTTGLGPITRPI